jgi:phosphopantothenoylcysteine decarboxylase/phosphopantothenate--cysteine ligase
MRGKTIVLGVGGGIAAYKACELASRLTQSGATVHVVLTENAARFVAPLTFQALTHQPVHTSLWPQDADTASGNGVFAAMAHIGLADAADAVLIAPATANILAKLAAGLADDLLSTLALATRAPVLLAPAMNPAMLAHPATQRNMTTLRALGYRLIEPESGRMACEHVGAGRLPETATLLAALQAVLQPSQELAGQRVLVTAGPTREALDAVRYLSNRSSGRMGYALAAEAAQRGAQTVLVSGPSALATPAGVERVDVTTAREMRDAVLSRASETDILIAAAAPADFRAVHIAPQKIKKRDLADGVLQLQLIANPDIVAEAARVKKSGAIIIGFAAETRDVVAEAQSKLREKGLDAIVANDVSQADAGFDVEANRVTWITAESAEEWPLLAKSEVAARIFAHIINCQTAESKEM